MGQMWGGMVLGAMGGFVVGHLHARTQQARSELATTKNAVPGIRKLFWGLFRKASAAWLAVIVLLIIAGYTAAAGRLR